ncbi:P-II family nitrogen regulator [Sulfurirhabdus autotrophica]|nr:P-II family nitrogen regulator [Sulfurirhabdus autotrophica]
MKEIKAFIHNHRIADVIRALKESGQCNADPTKGCRNLSIVGAQSMLKALDSKEQHYSVDLAESVISESRLELLCEDDQVDELVEIIRSKGRTGQPEAGWVVVMDVEKAVRIDEG